MHAFEFYGPLFAAWLKEQNEGRPVRFERVQPGDEQILPKREQRELDGVPSLLALRYDEDARAEAEDAGANRRPPPYHPGTKPRHGRGFATTKAPQT